MNAAKPILDDAFFLERTLPDRVPKPKVRLGIVQLPKAPKLDIKRAVRAWAAIGVEVSETRIRKHAAELQAWSSSSLWNQSADKRRPHPSGDGSQATQDC
jgi:hypothetical protein